MKNNSNYQKTRRRASRKNSPDHPFRLWEKRGKYAVVFPDRPRNQISTGVFIDPEAGSPSGRQAAIAWAYAYLDRLDSERGGDQTLLEFAKDFYIPDLCRWCIRKARKGKKYGDVYYTGHRSRLENHIFPRWGSVPLKNITVKGIDNWLLTLENPRTKSPYSTAQLDKLLYCFKNILDEAVYQEHIKENPARKVEPFTDDTGREPFTSEEIGKMFPEDFDQAIEIWGDLRWYIFFFLMYSGGLRPGEVCAFRLCDWRKDLHGALIYRAVESGTKKIKGLKTDGKGAASKPVAFPSRLEDLLQVYALQVTDPEDLLFRCDNGDMITPDVSGVHFKRSLKKAGIERRGRVQYCLRHTFYTDLLKKLPEEHVKMLAGHKNLRKEYDHRVGEDFLKADSGVVRETLDGILSQGTASGA